MIAFRRVHGESMRPALLSGDDVVIFRVHYSVGDIVMASVDGREVIKRVTRIEHDHVWLAGDNVAASTDSRHYGAVNKSAILGVMKLVMPRAVAPQKPRNRNASVLGWVAAGILVVFAVVHLFRIDTFVPELQLSLLLDRTSAAWLAGAVVCAEVFALPFVMRMRLSPLAQYASGALGVVVPLFWSLVAIWTYGLDISTAQLGEFVRLPSTAVLVGANLVWLVFAYYTLWALGYDLRPHEKQSFVTKFFSRFS